MGKKFNNNEIIIFTCIGFIILYTLYYYNRSFFQIESSTAKKSGLSDINKKLFEENNENQKGMPIVEENNSTSCYTSINNWCQIFNNTLAGNCGIIPIDNMRDLEKIKPSKNLIQLLSKMNIFPKVDPRRVKGHTPGYNWNKSSGTLFPQFENWVRKTSNEQIVPFNWDEKTYMNNFYIWQTTIYWPKEFMNKRNFVLLRENLTKEEKHEILDYIYNNTNANIVQFMNNTMYLYNSESTYRRPNPNLDQVFSSSKTNPKPYQEIWLVKDIVENSKKKWIVSCSIKN